MELAELARGYLTQGFISQEAESKFFVCMVGYGGIDLNLFPPR